MNMEKTMAVLRAGEAEGRRVRLQAFRHALASVLLQTSRVGGSRRLLLEARSGAGLFHGLIPASNRNAQSSAVSRSSFGFTPRTASTPTASALSTESAPALSRSRFNLHSSSKVIPSLLL